MKAAYKHDWEAIAEIFKFWYDRGFVDENKEIVLYFMEYIYNTHEINRDKLKKMLDDSKIDGGEIMQTLAQQMKEEFREELEEEVRQTLAQQMKEEFREELKEEFMETLGPQLKEEKARETAKNLLDMGIDIDRISKATGLGKTEIEKLASEI